MRDPVTPPQIYPALKALLGLPDNLVAFDLSVRAGEIVTVTCEHHVSLATLGLKQLESVFSHYELVHIPAPASDEAAADADEFRVVDFDSWMRDRTDAAHTEYMARHAAGGISYT